MNNKEITLFRIPFINMIPSLFTAVIGHHIHGGFWWTLFDFILWPIAWVKWMICQDVCISIIKDSFAFFLK